MADWHSFKEPKDIIARLEARLADVEKRVHSLQGGGGPGLTVVTFHLTHTWLVAGDVLVPTGQDDVIPSFFVAENTGSQSVTLKRLRAKIGAGTSATVKLQRNGADVSGYTGITVTTTAADTSGDVALSSNDELQLVVTAVSGTPENLSATLVMEHTTT